MLMAIGVCYFIEKVAAAKNDSEKLDAYKFYVFNGQYDARFQEEACHFFLNNASLKKADYKFIADDSSFHEIREQMIEKFLAIEKPTTEELRWATYKHNKKAWEMLKEKFLSTNHKKNYVQLYYSHTPGEHEEALQYKKEYPEEAELQETMQTLTCSQLTPDFVRPEAKILLHSLD